jgi:SAM-dependent methyltransferase
MSELLEPFFRFMRIRQINKHLPGSRKRVLDLGCGAGYLLSRVDFSEKYGIDVDLPKGSPYLKRDIKNRLPFSSGYFDCVTMTAVFEHIEENKIKDVISECHRVLKKGGRLIITTPTPIANPLIQLLGRLELVSRKGAEEHKKTYYRSSIMNIIAKAGFAKGSIRGNYFEFFMNVIVYADK